MDSVTELAAAITAASSPDWSVRAQAARQLARQAQRPEIAKLLLTLLLDTQDTAVTDATCHALLDREDIHSARLIAQAVATADNEHLDHLHSAVTDRHLHVSANGTSTPLKELCCELSRDPNPTIRGGAEQLTDWIRPWDPAR